MHKYKIFIGGISKRIKKDQKKMRNNNKIYLSNDILGDIRKSLSRHVVPIRRYNLT